MMRALPTVQRELGASGTTFTNAFASFPLCCPARATLLTGEYAHNHGTLGNNPLSGGGYQALREPGKNLARWLQANGYATGFAGKWLNGLRSPRAAPRGWDQWSGLIGEGGDGLSSYYDFDDLRARREAPHLRRPPARLPDRRAHPRLRAAVHRRAGRRPAPVLHVARLPPAPQRRRPQRPRGPPLLGRAARTSEEASRARSRPSATRGATSTRASRARPRSTSATSPTSRSSSRAARRLSDRDLETIDRDYRCGLAALRALDDGVGEIVGELRATGQLANTVLIFLTDQGVMAGEHRIKRGKNRPYEEAIGIPLLIRGPGVLPGRRGRGAGGQHRRRADDPRPRRRRGPGRARASDRRDLAGVPRSPACRPIPIARS